MPFEATAHTLLSAEGAALSAGQLAAQARLAEDLLGVAPDDYDDLVESTERRAWEEMVVLQINFQVARGAAGEALVQQSLGDLQQTFRKADVVSPAALALRDRFFGKGETVDGRFDVDGGSFFLDAIAE